MKPDYKLVLNARDELLIKRYGDRSLYFLDERYKLAILVDIYSGHYDAKLKNEALAIECSKLLIAFCHFDGKWIPEGRYQCNPPSMHSENSILVMGKKFESISESITHLLHGNATLAKDIIVDSYNFEKKGQKRLDLLDEYKNKCFAEEKSIVDKCFVSFNHTFDMTKYSVDINVYQADLHNSLTNNP